MLDLLLNKYAVLRQMRVTLSGILRHVPPNRNMPGRITDWCCKISPREQSVSTHTIISPSITKTFLPLIAAETTLILCEGGRGKCEGGRTYYLQKEEKDVHDNWKR